jgi:hypothetical protein
MNAPVLLKELAARGVMAHADGAELVLRPARSLDAALLAEVRAAKPELLELLATTPTVPPKSFYPRAAYDPAAATAHALSDDSLTSAQQSALLRFADEAAQQEAA